MSKSNNEKLLEEEEDEGEEEEEEEILIPNIAMREDMFVGFHEIAEASCFPSVSPVLENKGSSDDLVSSPRPPAEKTNRSTPFCASSENDC